MVRDRLIDLDRIVRGHGPALEWKLPDWVRAHADRFAAALDSPRDWAEYALMHDCGKPFCREIAADGKVHFPDHARVSADIYAAVGGHPAVSKLILFDMLVHAADTLEFDKGVCFQLAEEETLILLLSALAEIHANAGMFGGLDSESFKIKWKKVDRRGRRAFKLLDEA